MLPERGVEDPEAVQEAGWAERVYSNQRSQPFAVQQVTTEEGTSTYDYDANGNMTARMENGVSWTHTYNAENRLASLTNGATAWLFSYDGDGTLVGQLVTDGLTATHTAFFMGGGYEVISDGVTETVRKYYALAGQTFGMSDNGVMKYLISDHLGSTVAITDSTGNVLAETRYAERSGALRHFHVLDQVAEQTFGEPRADVGSITQTDKTYTGQRDVPDTGLMDYRARNYSPYLNRWTQPDTIIPNITNPQDWNRYTYTRNNPIKYVDPSGNMPTNGCNYEGCQEYATDEDNYQIIQEALFESPRGWKDLTQQYKDIISKGGVTQEYYEKTEMAGTPGVQNAKWYEDPAAWIAISFVGFKQAPSAVLAIGQYFCLDGDCGNEINISNHVIQRMAERHVSIEQLQNTLQMSSFRYFHNSQWKIGFYDSINRLFIGVAEEDNIITTIITNVKPQYIENLKKVIP